MHDMPELRKFSIFLSRKMPCIRLFELSKINVTISVGVQIDSKLEDKSARIDEVRSTLVDYVAN